MPIHDPSQPWLDRAIASVRAQLYADWELCIAGGASRSPQVRRILQQAASEDSRIRVVIREDQGEISSASNSALAAASGEFSLLLHQDDELTEHALYLLAHELSQNPEADLVYADEDKIDERGRVREPSFKPDWNPDL